MSDPKWNPNSEAQGFDIIRGKSFGLGPAGHVHGRNQLSVGKIRDPSDPNYAAIDAAHAAEQMLTISLAGIFAPSRSSRARDQLRKVECPRSAQRQQRRIGVAEATATSLRIAPNGPAAGSRAGSKQALVVAMLSNEKGAPEQKPYTNGLGEFFGGARFCFDSG